MNECRWDLVVLTAIDEAQKFSYEKQIDFYRQCGSIPDLKFRVYSDEPVGVKIGNGGGTLVALWKLHDEFGGNLLSQRILLLNAGGLCQRQPNASVCGKIFSLLPSADVIRPHPVLSLKCRLYQAILSRMPSGVFVAAADALEYLGLGSDEQWRLSPEGFTVLAHPSTLDVAVNHGVYVFQPEDLRRIINGTGVINIPVTKVLQKPSLQQLESSGAIIHNTTAVKPYAYTDSSYFMGSDVVEKLLALRTTLSPISCEIDAYGDFIQCLGTAATADYIKDVKNVLQHSDQLSAVRQIIFDQLHNCKAEALVLSNSAFYHIGTFKELLEHFCDDELFLERFGLAHKSFCHFHKSPSPADNSFKVDGSVVYSVLTRNSVSDEHSYVEFSQFPNGLTVGRNSIVSNCHYIGTEMSCIPPSTFISTFAVELSKGQVAYATVFFNTFNNLKLKSSSAADLPFFKGNLADSCASLGVDIETIFNGKEMNLWNAKMFPTADSMSDSFRLGVEMIKRLTSQLPSNNPLPTATATVNRVSMADILASKHFDSLMTYRRNLYELIKQLNSGLH